MTDKAISPLRQRMIEDMTIRKLAPKTQHDYVQRVKNFAAFLGRSPDTASFEDMRRYQLHLAASGVGVPTINQTVSTLRFFFRVTLRRHDIVEYTHFIHEPRKMPVVLNPEEVARLVVVEPVKACWIAMAVHRWVEDDNLVDRVKRRLTGRAGEHIDGVTSDLRDPHSTSDSSVTIPQFCPCDDAPPGGGRHAAAGSGSFASSHCCSCWQC